MMIALFIAHSSSYSNQSRYISMNKNYQGDWEIGHSSNIKQKILFLTNSSANSSGFAWFQHRLPANNWSFSTSIQISSFTSQVNCGFWITKDYQVFEPDFEKSSVLSGILVLFSMNYSSLKFEIQKKDVKINNCSKEVLCSLEKSYDTLTFPLLFQYYNNSLKVIIQLNSSILLFNQTIDLPSRRPYISITAHSLKENSFLSIPYFFFSPETQKIIFKNENYHMVNYEEMKNSIQLLNSFLKNSKNITESQNLTRSQSIDQYQKLSNFSQAVDIISVISSLTESTYYSFETSDLFSVFVIKQMLPFSQSWQRRSLQMELKSERLVVALRKALNESTNTLSTFRNLLTTEISELKNSVYQIESTLYFGIQQGNKLSKDLKKISKDIKYSSLSKFLLHIGIGEIILLCVTFSFSPFFFSKYT